MGKLLDNFDPSFRYHVLSFMFHPEHLIWYRMEGFTEISPSGEAIKHVRRISGQDFEITDIVGQSFSIQYSFRHFAGNPVLEYLRGLYEKRMSGVDAVVQICTVLVSDFCELGTQLGTVQQFCVEPSTAFETTGLLGYGGRFLVNGDKKQCLVCPEPGWNRINIIGGANNERYH